jgi:hypothetical protein
MEFVNLLTPVLFISFKLTNPKFRAEASPSPAISHSLSAISISLLPAFSPCLSSFTFSGRGESRSAIEIAGLISRPFRLRLTSDASYPLTSRSQASPGGEGKKIKTRLRRPTLPRDVNVVPSVQHTFLVMISPRPEELHMHSIHTRNTSRNGASFHWIVP